MTSKAILFLLDSLNLPTAQIWLIGEEPSLRTDSLNKRTAPFLLFIFGFNGIVSHPRIFDRVRPSSGILARKLIAKSSSKKESMRFSLVPLLGSHAGSSNHSVRLPRTNVVKSRLPTEQTDQSLQQWYSLIPPCISECWLPKHRVG